MGELDFMQYVLEGLGGAAAAFAIGFLWMRELRATLRRLREEKQAIQDKLDQMQLDRIMEMQTQMRLMEEFKNMIRHRDE